MTSALLNDLLARVTVAGRALVGPQVARRKASDGPPGVLSICERLVAGRGEATELALARQALDLYAGLNGGQRKAFFLGLVEHFGVERERLDRALAHWREKPGDAEARALHDACEPVSQELIRRLNRTPGGARDLVAMRADLLRHLRDEPTLAGLDHDFQHLFSSWFNRGFLQLRRLDWSSPASVLEKIIQYEAVHDINGWDDLRRRVGSPDRRLYAFFHPALSEEPLIFVEVALVQGVPAAIAPILAEDREPLAPEKADTAAFYSISNCQPGLRGVSFGSFLIKQVVEDLRAELRGLKCFVTLSPVPGLRDWATAEAARGEDGILLPAERELVERLDRPETVWDEITGHAPGLAALAARYLLEAKRRGGQPVDPVARFHLGNGARLERINACADASPRGLRNAWGVMVNYQYALENIERNHEAFAATGKVAAASAVRRLLTSR